jgi:hypothetical protein
VLKHAGIFVFSSHNRSHLDEPHNAVATRVRYSLLTSFKRKIWRVLLAPRHLRCGVTRSPHPNMQSATTAGFGTHYWRIIFRFAARLISSKSWDSRSKESSTRQLLKIRSPSPGAFCEKAISMYHRSRPEIAVLASPTFFGQPCDSNSGSPSKLPRNH